MIIQFNNMVDVSYVKEDIFITRIGDDKLPRKMCEKPKFLFTSNYNFNAIFFIKRK